MGSQVCQHPLVTLRNDAVEEKQGLSSCFFPAPPAHTHRDIHIPGSSKPQLDRTFAMGSKHRLLALQSKLPSKESCRVQQPKNQPPGMVAPLGKPWYCSGRRASPDTPSLAWYSHEAGTWINCTFFSSSFVPHKVAYSGRLRENLSYRR